MVVPFAPVNTPDGVTQTTVVREESPSPGLPEGVTATETVTSSVASERDRPWLSRHLRNLIALILVLDVSYLGLALRNETAIATLVAMLATLGGAIWGERASLKVPGRDN